MNKGFTLIELVFVVVLLALFSTFAIPKASSVLGINLRTAATGVSGYLQASYEQAVMRHERLRVRFDFKSGNYWAEKYERSSTIPPLDANIKIDEVVKKFEDRETQQLSDEEKLQKSQEDYKKVEAGTLKTAALPDGVKFKSVYVASEGRIVEGDSSQVPWIDFLPGGFASKAIVYVTNDSGDIYSVILPALGGRSRIEKGEVRPDDV